MTEPSVFDGFPPEGLQFLAGLAENNSRSWFDAHRSIYEECLQAPARALVLSPGEELRRRVSSDIRFEPRVGKSLFRINRDLRFTKDKTPYNPWLDAVFWEGDDARSSPSLFLRITADDVTVGAGIFRMQGSMLGRYRDAVLDDRLGPRLRRVLTAITSNQPRSTSLTSSTGALTTTNDSRPSINGSSAHSAETHRSEVTTDFTLANVKSWEPEGAQDLRRGCWRAPMLSSTRGLRVGRARRVPRRTRRPRAR